MAYTPVRTVNFTGLPDTGTVAAGAEIVPGVRDLLGALGQVLSGRLSVTLDSNFPNRDGTVYFPEANGETNARITLAVEAGEFVQGMGFVVGLRQLFGNADWSGVNVLFCRGDNILTPGLRVDVGNFDRAVNGFTNYGGELDATVGGFNPALKHFFRVTAEGGNPLVVTWEILAADGVTVEASGTRNITLAESAPQQTVTDPPNGCAITLNRGMINSGHSGALVDAVFSSLVVETESATDPLEVEIPTLESRASGENTLSSNVANGLPPYAYAHHVSRDPVFTPGPTNDIEGEAAAEFTHSFTPDDYRAPYRPSLILGGALRFYKDVITDDEDTTITSGRTTVEDVFAARSTPEVRADIKATRKLVYGQMGDSITVAAPLRAAELARLTDEWGIPEANIVAVPFGDPGSELMAHWQEDSAPRNGNDASNLAEFREDMEAAVSANPGCLALAHINLGANDLINYTTLLPADYVAAQKAMTAYLREGTGLSDLLVVWGQISYYTGLDASDAKMSFLLDLIDAQLADPDLYGGADNGVYCGMFDIWNLGNRDRTLMSDFIHPDNAPLAGYGGLTGEQVYGEYRADSVVYSRALMGDPDTTPPTVSSAVLGADGVTLTLTMSETTAGTTGLTVKVANVTRSVTSWVNNGTTIVGTLASVAYAGQAVTYSYAPGSGNVLDESDNELATITDAAVTNNSEEEQDTTAPTITAAVLASNGLTLTLTTSETTTGTAGFTVTVNGVTRSVTWARTNGTTLTGTLASVAYLGAALTYSYAPGSGNILDAAGNELATISAASVTNNSTQTESGGGGGGTGTVTYRIAAGRGRLPIETLYLTAGDTAGALETVLRDANRNPVPIGDGSTVLFRLRLVGASAAAVGGAATIDDGADGEVSFTFSEDTPVPAAGRYEATFQVDGLTYPVVTHGNRIPVLIREAL